MKQVQIGVVGCGNISGIYFENLTKNFENTQVYACADLDAQKAKDAAEKWGIPHIMTFEEMLTCDDIQLILNLTTPQSHYSLCKKAILAGKHVYVEKPLSLELEQGQELVQLAKEQGVLLGGAPDTFMGAGIQTCKKLIGSGIIGTCVGATAYMMCHGHESWHPDPEFYYKKGGGPLFDMGPYYLTALVHLMGKVQQVCAMEAITFPQRTITSAPKRGTVIDVEVPTHVAGLMQFENGAIGNLITTFDVWESTLPRIEIYGSLGTLLVPDPNTFGGPVLLASKEGGGFKELPLLFGHAQNSRGLGVSDMARCILEETERHQANGNQTCHVLEIMTAFDKSSRLKQFVSIG